MSDTLQVALVAEGPTDRIVVEAALGAVMKGRDFVLKQLQPEGSVAFGPLGGGWTGVYRWCKQAAVRAGGRFADDVLFRTYDLLILQLDADTADKEYSDGNIEPEPGDGTLPCAKPCPPASATTDALRAVLLTWCAETRTPPRTVICMPSKSTEAWVVAALYPGDASLRKTIECLPDPVARLGQQPKGKRIRKAQRDYQDRQADIQKAWGRLVAREGLGEARRFQEEFLAAAPAG
ncbi:MAG: hypothetical protein AAB215_01470 [Planctomycetota bacterium]